MMKIPVNRPLIYPETYKKIRNIISSGWLSAEGPQVKLFEKAFSSYVGMRYGATTNSGTTALHLALLTLGIGPGDEVILPAMTIASCYFAIWYVGAKAIPVDIDKDTYTINPSLIEKYITKKTKVIMPVHLYGHPCDMDPIMALAKKYHLYILEDAAEAHGAEYKGKKVGSFGDISIFSFYANKIVSCGEGGMMLTNNKQWYEQALKLKNLSHVKNKRFTHDAIGYRYQMTNIQAALGLISLSHIRESIMLKRKMAAYYYKHLHTIPSIITPIEKPWAKSVYWMYAIRIKKNTYGVSKDLLMKNLSKHGIQTRPFFYAPDSMFRKLGLYQRIDTPIAKIVEKEGLYIPSGLGNTKNEFTSVIKKLSENNNNRKVCY
ncbi:MAG: DegT/DnrJ/EryC1/StrS aminotransferase [Microgenomates group bacterium GW2011_GWB1_40_9]|nr:MAG: DegT/DnrJ/EryC1/StrS aminotransferase [Microgenomates group bacterium GW2011_GWC1_39_12]KKR79977.1 MAG: DegT/DnrJ/EryC1/StrS aminotransferase [Microgenomates group bacterium GW2011_GWB1_40_9]